MSKRKAYISPIFKKYEKFIIHCGNYNTMFEGHPCIKKEKNGGVDWIEIGNKEVRLARRNWANYEAKQKGFKTPLTSGELSKLMFKLHPTDCKPCRHCGHIMSLRYIYISKNLQHDMAKIGIHISTYELRYSSIFDIFNKLEHAKDFNKINSLKRLLIKKFQLNYNIHDTVKTIVNAADYICRGLGKHQKILSPGALSNYPDRFDGFHDLNHCCRVLKDKGRNPSHMRAYTRDRRVYHYFNDGNINATDEFINSGIFKNGSADHIGPLALGFKHTLYNLRNISRNQNEAKGDRINSRIISLIIKREKKYHINLMSQYGELLWKSIEKRFHNNKTRHYISNAEQILNINVRNFLYFLWYIITHSKNGKKFILAYYIKPRFYQLKPKGKNYYYRYKFTSFKDINKHQCHWPRIKKRVTKNTIKHFYHGENKTFTDVISYHNKKNRKIKHDINNKNIKFDLFLFTQTLNSKHNNFNKLKKLWRILLIDNQKYLITKL